MKVSKVSFVLTSSLAVSKSFNVLAIFAGISAENFPLDTVFFFRLYILSILQIFPPHLGFENTRLNLAVVFLVLGNHFWPFWRNIDQFFGGALLKDNRILKQKFLF